MKIVISSKCVESNSGATFFPWLIEKFKIFLSNENFLDEEYSRAASDEWKQNFWFKFCDDLKWIYFCIVLFIAFEIWDALLIWEKVALQRNIFEKQILWDDSNMPIFCIIFMQCSILTFDIHKNTHLKYRIQHGCLYL